jgi:hypothetical protein
VTEQIKTENMKTVKDKKNIYILFSAAITETFVFMQNDLYDPDCDTILSYI